MVVFNLVNGKPTPVPRRESENESETKKGRLVRLALCPSLFRRERVRRGSAQSRERVSSPSLPAACSFSDFLFRKRDIPS